MLILSGLIFNARSGTSLDSSVGFALAVAAILTVIVFHSRRNQLSLPEIAPRPSAAEATDPPAADAPDCMVVIPARNEERMIGRAVKSLPPDSVIVVDDASKDRTADVARSAGAGVVKAPKVLPGTVGKANACAEGARLLTSRWILFADADTWYEPGFLESAIAAAETARVDFLSIYLRPAYESFRGHLMAPYAVALYFFGVNPRSGPAEAFQGQCILARREPYEFVGGHGAVRQYLNEDLKLAALAARHRLKFGVARAGALGRVRIDPESFERGAHRFTIVSPWIGVRIMLAALAFSLWGPAFLWLLVDGHRIFAAAIALWPPLMLSRWYGWKLALLAPFGIYVLAPKLVTGAFGALAGRRVEWKGRVI